MTYPLRIELAEDAYLALVNTAQHYRADARTISRAMAE